MKRWLPGIGLLVALAGIGGGLWWDYQRFLAQPLAVSGEGQVLEVRPGSSIAVIAEELVARGVLTHPWQSWYLQAYARLQGLAPKLKTGEYALEPELTPRELLARIVAGKVIQYSLTVVEGWTFRQLRAALRAHPQLEQTLQDLGDEEVMARLGHPGLHPEGRFFPDTYRFPRGTRDLDFLQRAFATMQKKLDEVWARRAADLPLQSPDEVLILASIVEKETALPSERREIAGVFARRLQKNMPLQTDPSVIYGLGDGFDGNLRRQDLEADTPYNTYTRTGLPPTPIALPGAAALAAAVDPAPGDALYFVARGDGSGGHVFSRTLEEHNRAVRQYLHNRRAGEAGP
ncbi:MAG TPA: endolytic transglycosylase MltG [Candidatus Competibacteraceae bacterium]|nr:endolytic transglycosylase MltG [Candidatus Competibacteraceae bacterium]